MEKIFLASASPRRAELLTALGIDFTVCAPEADENSIDQNIPTGLYVQELALLKASAAAQKLLDETDALIIAADTVVCIEDEILGKPQDREDAKRMLNALSGRTHDVYTGFCVMRVSDGFTVCDHTCTHVKFLPLTDEKIDGYIRTGEPMDKAGAYGIQGFGATLVEKIDGDYFTVVGLPVAALTTLLEKEFDFRIF